jgi:Domain of unknown function (DUF4340)
VSPRTTIVLLVLVALAGGGIWWATRGDPGGALGGGTGRRILPGLQASDVTAITIRSERTDTPLKGTLALARVDDGAWTVRVGEEAPVRARSERVRTLLETLREGIFVRVLTSASQDEPGKFGLDPGRRVLVTLATSSGATRTLEFGAVVTESGVAVRTDGGWPPVEVDRQILDEVSAESGKWAETRLVPFDASVATAVRATFPKRPEAGFRASREAGRWAIREPALMRADEALVMRLIASLSSIETRGPWESSGAPPAVLVRYEIEVPPQAKPFVVEIGEGSQGEHVPAREGVAEKWRAVSLAGLELVTQPGSHFRSRRLLDLEAGDLQEVKVDPGAAGPLHLVRRGPRLEFQPPPEWGWKFLGTPRTLPLDPSAQSDFLQALSELEATELEAGGPFEPALTASIRHGPAGAPGAEIRLRFGKDEGGKRAFARIAETREGRVKSSDAAFLQKPYWELLARQANLAAWFSLATIEVEEVGRRKVVITALGNAGTEPDFALTEPKAEAQRRVPRELANPLTDKICFLTVDRFVGHGKPEAFGLDRPRYVVRWHDAATSQGVAPDSRKGQWVTWRIGERGPDGTHTCDLDIQPGLVFALPGRDLDPVINLLEWATK